MRLLRTILLLIVTGLLALGVVSEDATAGGDRPPVIAVAVEGDIAPGTGATMALCGAGEYEDGTFDEPMTNAGGEVLFWTCLSDGGWALYLMHADESLELIARSGQEVAGIGTLPASSSDFIFTDGPALNDRSTSIFAIRQGITGQDAPESALFMKAKEGDLQAVLRSGDPSPCGGTFHRFDDMSLNNRDGVAINATYTDATIKAGTFLRLSDGTVQAIVCNGDALPGTGETFIGDHGDSLDGPWVNDNRVVAFGADQITGPTVNDPDEGEISIWTGSVFAKRPGQPIEKFILPGDPIPASVDGGVVAEVKPARPALNNDNELGFLLVRETSTLAHPGEQFIASKALGGPIEICLEDFTAAPETGSFEGFSAVAMNQFGDMQFTADIDPQAVPDDDDADNIRGIFTCNNGQVTTVVRQTDDTKPTGSVWSFELEEGSIGGGVVVFLDEVNFTAASTERGVFRAGEPTTLQQGDVNCDGVVDEDDLRLLLLVVGGLTEGQQQAPCPDVGEPLPLSAIRWGDVNCDGIVDARDALYVLLHRAGVPSAWVNGCIGIGQYAP